MQKHQVIELELANGRNDELIVRRLYSTDFPKAFEDRKDCLFDILEAASSFLKLPISTVKIAGSAQTGYSFHNQKPFIPGSSDLDLAIISEIYFERLMRAAQNAAIPNPDSLERPRRNAFPEIKGQNSYNSFIENVAVYGMIHPHHLPDCDEKRELSRITRKLTEKYTGMFKSISVSAYISQYFFERKQRPNLGLYKQARKEV